jgi:hypothetical protein
VNYLHPDNSSNENHSGRDSSNLFNSNRRFF